LKQLSSATALLQELPMFKHQNYSKIASIAYCMRSQTYSLESTIARCNQVINNVFLVVDGNIKVYVQNIEKDEKDHKFHTKLLDNRLPKLAVAILGRGQIVGAIELLKGLKTFEYTYVTSSASTEVLEMSAELYKESIYIPPDDTKSAQVVSSNLSEDIERNRIKRLARACDAIRSMMVLSTSSNQSKQDMLSILPQIIEPMATTSTKLTYYSSHGSSDPSTLNENKKSTEKLFTSRTYENSSLNDSNGTNSSFFVTSRKSGKHQNNFSYAELHSPKKSQSSFNINNLRNKFTKHAIMES
jgi:CRP-like cAMP-binding protein